MNQSYASVNAWMLRSCGCEVFRVQLYKNNACTILSILNSDCQQHARNVRTVYEFLLIGAIYKNCPALVYHHVLPKNPKYSLSDSIGYRIQMLLFHYAKVLASQIKITEQNSF